MNGMFIPQPKQNMIYNSKENREEARKKRIKQIKEQRAQRIMKSIMEQVIITNRDADQEINDTSEERLEMDQLEIDQIAQNDEKRKKN